MDSEFDWLARNLESCLGEPDGLPGARPSPIGEDLAKAALVFMANPSRSIVAAARDASPSLSPDQVRRVLKAVAQAILASKSRTF
ncbi:MAG TPA: hypothetical protein VNB28_07860 [Methylomirabilota bacterium]|jgi:hypothetical protein|nr:hypothetical protein [Methylomirabilota bacterium]